MVVITAWTVNAEQIEGVQDVAEIIIDVTYK